MQTRRLLGIAFLLASSAGAAQAACVVTDPTGTPLNVRTRPNGPILGALYNGAPVRRVDTTYDDRGRPWSLVEPLEGGKSGWVFREFMSCD